jgi:hypothetical protein
VNVAFKLVSSSFDDVRIRPWLEYNTPGKFTAQALAAGLIRSRHEAASFEITIVGRGCHRVMDVIIKDDQEDLDRISGWIRGVADVGGLGKVVIEVWRK